MSDDGADLGMNACREYRGRRVTFDDDFMRLHLSIGARDALLRQMEIAWPPPPRIFLDEGATLRVARDGDDPAFVMVRTSMSEITDEQRAGMTHVCRGAEYRYLTEVEA